MDVIIQKTFLHSNCISITIPDYFVSGYYFVNGVGLFRYVSDADAGKYNGESYDENINWNEPMIIYDENGFKISDPSDPDIEKEETTESDPGIEVTNEDKQSSITSRTVLNFYDGEEETNAGSD